jgi:hypothetical protein
VVIQPTIDFGAALRAAAESQGYLSPEAFAELQERLGARPGNRGVAGSPNGG